MNCSKCNTPLQGNETFCPNCGVFIRIDEPMQPESSNSIHTIASPHTLHSTSFPSNSQATYGVPPEIKKWNWGAFTFNIVWGIGNYTYLPLLCLIPIINIIWIFVCGFKGNEWAWKSGKFTNIEDFLATQETWSRAGFIYFIVSIAVLALILFLSSLFISL